MTEIIWSSKADEILRVGKKLDSIGVRNWALTKLQALQVLGELGKNKIPILGGDVYVEDTDGVIKLSYSNWYCDRLPGETLDHYLARSIAKAEEYITNFKVVNSAKVFFAIVPGVGV